MNIYVQEFFFLVSFKNIDANKMGQKWPFASFYKENKKGKYGWVWREFGRLYLASPVTKPKWNLQELIKNLMRGLYYDFTFFFSVTWYGNLLVK